MRAVVQRVSRCSVRVGERETGSIGAGLLVYLGVGRNDTDQDVHAIVDKIINVRVFPDDAGKMNLSIRQTGGGILVVSQFTLYADARQGRRPSYSDAAQPDKARALYENALRELEATGLTVASGEFAALMEVTYTNVGPVTILIDTEKKF
jgi:D-tyrosyl-tRNA(Tyr) deacylase